MIEFTVTCFETSEGSTPLKSFSMLTQPLGPITSLTKKATLLIIGPQPTSYQPTEASSKTTCSAP